MKPQPALFALLTALLVMLTSCTTDSPLALSSTFTPIYCNDYEFTCCVREEIGAGYSVTWAANQGDLHTCDGTADYCKATGSITSPEYASFYAAPDVTKCTYSGGSIISEKGYKCTGERYLGRTISGLTLQPKEVLYMRTPTSISTTSASVSIQTYKSKLIFTGTSGGIIGAPVLGADKCTFASPKNIYGTGGQLISSGGTASYTVATGSCVLSYQSGDRHICGNIEEQCKLDTDCGGHTYGNQECTARTLQTYGCRQLSGAAPTQEEIDLAYKLGQDLSYTKSRCEIVSARSVQCCGDTDCGSSQFCDKNPSSPTAWTCRATAQCSQNADCGVSQQCDVATKTLRTPTCAAGQCAFTSQPVGCCSDVNCPSGQFCAADRTCKDNAQTKTACPFGCCLGEPAYFDKPCSAGSSCCGDGTCRPDCFGIPSGTSQQKCEANGGTWVEKNEESCLLGPLFCTTTTTGVCRIPHVPLAAVGLLAGGVVLALIGVRRRREALTFLVLGAIIVLGALAWLILAGAGRV